MPRKPLGTEPDAPGPTVLGFLACAVVQRRDAYRQVGGFAERLGTYGEEALLAMDLAAAGWNLAYVPELVAHHLPVPAGRDPGARRRAEARNRVLTAALRRPGSVLRAGVADAWRDPTGRAGLRDAARQAGWVLRHRRRLPAEVEAALATLSRVGATAPLSAVVPEPVPSRAA
ncbi:hypothetical protein [Micromonospora fulviviridis]|uniref:Glycosyltransferase family 2 protein n=1 Tax=Micromonospora fulviviridis TaxID=47860 RepID=A0ABV2VSS2_9ACTN